MPRVRSYHWLLMTIIVGGAGASFASSPITTMELDEALERITMRHRYPNTERLEAIERIRKSSPDQRIPEIVAALAGVTNERDLRDQAEQAILETFGSSAADTLIVTLGDSTVSAAVRCRVAGILGRIRGIPDHQSEPILSALTTALGDERPNVRIAAAQALLQRGRIGVVTLTQALDAQEPLAFITAADAVGSLAIAGATEMKPLLRPAEKRLHRRVAVDDPRVRYAAIAALDRLWKSRQSVDNEAKLRRFHLIVVAEEDPDDFIRRYARSVADELRNADAQWLANDALRHNDPRIRIFAARSLQGQLAFETIPSLEAAIESETDPTARRELRDAATRLAVLQAKSTGSDRLRKALIALGAFTLLAIVAPFVREWRLKRLADREARIRANREYIAETFGIAQLNDDTAGYAAILAEIKHMDLRPEADARHRFAACLERLRQRFDLTAVDLKCEFPFKPDLIVQLLHLASSESKRLNSLLFSSGSLLRIEVGRATPTLEESDFSGVSAPGKAKMIVTLLTNDLRQRQENARQSLALAIDRWKLSLTDIQNAPARTRIAFFSAIVASRDSHERLHTVLSELVSRFTFLAPSKVAKLPAEDKMALMIACGQQDKSLSAFEEFVQAAALKPLRMGTMESLVRILKPSAEAEDEMLRVHANRIAEMLLEYSVRADVCEELMLRGKEHVVSQVFDQMGQVRVEEREAIGELMKTGPIARVMRKQAEESRQKRVEIEQHAESENVRLIRRLLELSELNEDGRRRFREAIEANLTAQDRSNFDIGGLPAKRLRELLNIAIGTVVQSEEE